MKSKCSPAHVAVLTLFKVLVLSVRIGHVVLFVFAALAAATVAEDEAEEEGGQRSGRHGDGQRLDRVLGLRLVGRDPGPIVASDRTHIVVRIVQVQTAVHSGVHVGSAGSVVFVAVRHVRGHVAVRGERFAAPGRARRRRRRGWKIRVEERRFRHAGSRRGRGHVSGAVVATGRRLDHRFAVRRIGTRFVRSRVDILEQIGFQRPRPDGHALLPALVPGAVRVT